MIVTPSLQLDTLPMDEEPIVVTPSPLQPKKLLEETPDKARVHFRFVHL